MESPSQQSHGRASPAVRRMMSERPGLEEEKPEYKVFFEDQSLMKCTAFIFGPDDSIYRHKLLKLRLEIPENYPSVSQTIQYSLIYPDRQECETNSGCLQRDHQR
jgi:ubiquitin-protein ligase